MKLRIKLLSLLWLFYSLELLGQDCSVNVTPMVFGSLESQAGPPVDSSGNVSLVCDAPVSYLIRIDAGANSNGQFNTRKMGRVGGSDTMAYNLFRDASKTFIWGDGTGASSIVSGEMVGNITDIPVYGSIYGGQNLTAGDYADSVLVTVEW